MYEDDETWKLHYDDWCKVYDKIKKDPTDHYTTEEQKEYRLECIKSLIDEYESSPSQPEHMHFQ
jgi:hypothetical protein